MPSIKHVLFDNDGTIVDSEILAVRSMLRLLAAHGRHMSEREYCRQFPGITLRDILAIWKEQHQIVISEDMLQELRAEHIRLFQRELRAVPGMHKLFRTLKTPKSMVSNGSVRHVEQSLRRVRLRHALDGHIFSAEQVARPKPHPDVYQHAVKTLQLASHEVVAVEDSPVGVRAAKEANLLVIGFLGASHVQDDQEEVLRTMGADLIAKDARQLSRHLYNLGIP